MMMRTIYFTPLLVLFTLSANAQWSAAGDINQVIYRSGNVAIGAQHPAGNNSKLFLSSNGSYMSLLPEVTGIGNLLQIGGQQGLNFGVSSYRIQDQKLITHIGINYAINGANGLTQYAVIGMKKAPMIQLDAEEGAINLFGESGTGADFRFPQLNLGLSVSSAGNVGIGVHDSPEKLNVYNNNAPTKILIGNPNTKTDGFTSLSLGTSADANGYAFLQSIGAAGSSFGALVLNRLGGNVGIGTTTPDHKLTVDGGVKCEEILVEIFEGTGPDYVFEKGYNLLPLSELEAYINENNHLPEVPSANEMEANGINLKEMNLLLLKKVEELTLHLIEANKKIENLDKQVQSLKK